MYEKRKKDLATLNKRVTELNNKFCQVLHYWKVRCEERKALTVSLKKARTLVERLENMEKNFASVFNVDKFHWKGKRVHRTKKGERLYIFYATHNEILRIRGYFKSELGYKFVLRRKDLVPVFLNKSHYARLKNFLKRRRNSHG